MGIRKTGGSSWPTIVKRDFRSPTKKSYKRSTEEDDNGEKEINLLCYLFCLNFEDFVTLTRPYRCLSVVIKLKLKMFGCFLRFLCASKS